MAQVQIGVFVTEASGVATYVRVRMYERTYARTCQHASGSSAMVYHLFYVGVLQKADAYWGACSCEVYWGAEFAKCRLLFTTLAAGDHQQGALRPKHPQHARHDTSARRLRRRQRCLRWRALGGTRRSLP